MAVLVRVRYKGQARALSSSSAPDGVSTRITSKSRPDGKPRFTLSAAFSSARSDAATVTLRFCATTSLALMRTLNSRTGCLARAAAAFALPLQQQNNMAC